MKKRILALTVCLAMVFSLTAFAADGIDGSDSSEISVSQSESSVSAEPADDSSSSSSEEASDVSSSASSEESAVSKEESSEVSSVESGVESSETSSEVSGEESSETSSEESSEESSEPSVPEEFTAEAAYEYLLLIQEDKEAFNAYLDQLTSEQLAELLTYMDTLGLEENPLPLLDDYLEQRFPPYEFLTCENDSNAAPLMEYVLPKRSMFRISPKVQEDDNGLVTSKTVKENEDGTYTLRLEAYATGATHTTQTSKPTDIVLVLDTSGSMDDYISVADKNTVTNLDPQYAEYYKWQANFGVGDEWREMRYKDGKWQYEAGSWPIFFWKDCGNSWFGNAAGIQKINALKIAVDGFLTSVGEDGGDNRVALVTYASGATLKNDLTTNYEAIKSEVWNLSANGATYADAGMTQAKTVLDRIPADRDSNKVVIMFTDGEPNHGSGFDQKVANSAIGTSKAMKDSGVTVYTIGVFESADNTDITSDFNRYMNYVSSNYPKAENMNKGGEKYEHPNGGSYYLTADNLAVLEEIFQNISKEVGGATNSKLDKTTVVKDIIADYFQLPDGADAADITVKTADCTSFTGDSPDWTNEQVLGSLTEDDIVVNEQTISVKGFNFSENYVGKNVTTGVVHAGKKLIVEIPIVVRDGFLGGNDVPTNGTASGVYDKDGTLVENFNVPTVDVDIPDVAVTAADKNIYLLGGLTTEQMKDGMTVKVGNVTLDMSADAENYGLEAWQNAYVDISIGDGLSEKTNLAEDDTYVVDVTVSPTTEKDGGVGAQSGNDQGNINVFTPELTFKDGEVYYGADAPTQAELAKNLTDTKWKHKNTDGTIVEAVPANMIGTAPTLAPSYTLNSDKINTKQDIPVDVTVKIGETDVTGKTAFVHTKCNGSEQDPENGKFLLHVFTPVLTFKDSEVYYGDTVPTDFTGNLASTVWMHGETVADATKMGAAPTLTATHTLDSAKILVVGGVSKINTKQDIPVSVTVKVGDFDVTGVVEFKHTDCKTDENLLGGKFLLHVKTCQLTITKIGGADDEPYVFTVYKDNAKYTEVTIKGNSSVTIYELPVGNYSIEEDTGWSWRYTATYSGNVTLSKDTTSGTITCTNTKKLPYWLNGFSDIIANISGERKEGGEDND